MLHYEFDAKYNDIFICNSKDSFGVLSYSIKENIVFIEQIERFSLSNIHYPDLHIGTLLLNRLLVHLILLKKNFSCIRGVLSYADADNNWMNSIPFYMDFPNHLVPCLKFSLISHLYNTKNFTDEYFLSQNREVRKQEIKTFCINHKNPNQNASFQYDILYKD